jgi:hypothetical protein
VEAPRTTSGAGSQSAPKVGFVDTAELRSIRETLLNSSAQEDIDLAKWIGDNYFDPPLNLREESRRIESDDCLEVLFQAYRRARSLSNNTKPTEWPLFTPEWKKMTRSMIKQRRQAVGNDRNHPEKVASGTSHLALTHCRGPLTSTQTAFN